MNAVQSTRRNFLLAAAGGGLGAAAAASGPSSLHVQAADNAGDLTIPERKVAVLAEADVVVCGGGTAGISAACCAARHGAKVVLLERWPSVGGMAVNALVNIWHTSDRARQVILGFTQEAIERGGRFVHKMDHYPQRHETHEFDSTGMRVVFQRMLDEAGVRTFCMVMGQGVGTCAALALSAGVDMAKFDVRKLQVQLRKDGVYLEDVPA